MNILNFLALVWLVLVRLLRLDLVLKSPFANRITQDDRKLKSVKFFSRKKAIMLLLGRAFEPANTWT